MRILFGVLSLLLVVTVIGVAARKQLQAAPTLSAAPAASSPAAAANVMQQSQQIQQQVRDDVNKLMQERAGQLEAQTK
jgi:hypothetical protein